ncbi:MAG: dihydroorotase [Oscillospiraceae bacterium]|nr:dihydroorotase [Oscillospiraceae bacterium]MCL2153337.1 dihydroorotase [Oscillospiraceae bacterium]
MLLIKGGHVCGSSERSTDILIENSKISLIAESITESCETTVLDASGLVIAPGLVDMHTHFRDPGFEYKEDILTGAAAAAAGGVTTCCCMPNTSPVADSAEVIEYIVDKAKTTPIRVMPYGAVTIGQKGGELTDFEQLKAAGAVALSDDGNPIESAGLARRAMQLASKCGLMIISHCEDAEMVKDFAVNEGAVSSKLGIPGRPAIAEEIMVARDALLAAETGARVHIAHVSTAGSVEIIRRMKAADATITAETCPQYFTLTEDDVLTKGALARVNPPLRSAEDVAAIIRGLADGTIDAIATDHAPHSEAEKSLPLTEAPSGMIGLETSLALALKFLYHTGELSMERIIALMSTNPARMLGIEGGTLAVGSVADIVIFDPDGVWTVDPNQFKSKARNTPYAGMSLRGRVLYTISRGKLVYNHNAWCANSQKKGV